MEPQYEFYVNDTNNGERVHPRNWMYRVALWAADFDDNKRLKYNPLLTPLIHSGRCCLRIDNTNLKKEFPEIHECVIDIIKSLDVKQLT